MALVREGDSARDLYLYDTFSEEMPPAGESDIRLHGSLRGTDPVAIDLKGQSRADDVAHLLERTGYPPEGIHVVAGRVEETILPPTRPRRSRSCASTPTGTTRRGTSPSTSTRV